MLKTLTFDEARNELRDLLRRKSVFHGDFTLASGAKSNYYIDCRLTTFDARGAWLVGQCMYTLMRKEEAARELDITAVGGLTMGADPVSLAVSMYSDLDGAAEPWKCFSVRKAPKAHGQTKLIEGNFQKGDTVVIIDDVITRAESSITALNAVLNEGGEIGFVAALVDRQEGGRVRLEEMGYPVVALFTRDELLQS